MISLVLFGVLLSLMSLGVPVAFAIGAAGSAAVVLMQRVNFELIVQRMFYGVDSFLLLAVPLFIFLGEVMERARITERLIAFVATLVGHVRGGLGHVAVLSEMVLSGITGSGSADAAATGTVMIPAMTRAGYPPAFAAALLGAAATLGPIIPPSVVMVIYGSVAQVSVARLFIGGVVPGLVMGVYLMVVTAWYARKRGWVRGPRPTWRQIAHEGRTAYLVVLAPVVIIGGILTGAFTATESAAVGCVYALVLGLVIYRSVRLSEMRELLARSLLSSAKVMFIVSVSYIFSWILAREGVPAQIAQLPFFSAGTSPWVILLTLNVLLLVLGCLMEAIAVLIIITPMILPIATAAGIDLVHLGVIMAVNLSIGLITPPVGVVMYIVCAISRTSVAEFTREAWPFLIALGFALVAVTYVPALTLALPNALLGP